MRKANLAVLGVGKVEPKVRRSPRLRSDKLVPTRLQLIWLMAWSLLHARWRGAYLIQTLTWAGSVDSYNFIY